MDINNISSMYSTLYNSNPDVTATNLEKNIKSDYTGATDEELMDVCKQFESYFVEQVYKEMLKTIPESEKSSASQSTLMDYYKDQFVQTIASQTTESSSLGLAQTLYEQMKRTTLTAEDLNNLTGADD